MSKESRCGISISEYWRRVYMKVVARDNQKTLTDQELIALGLKENEIQNSQKTIVKQINNKPLSEEVINNVSNKSLITETNRDDKNDQ